MNTLKTHKEAHRIHKRHTFSRLDDVEKHQFISVPVWTGNLLHYVLNIVCAQTSNDAKGVLLLQCYIPGLPLQPSH